MLGSAIATKRSMRTATLLLVGSIGFVLPAPARAGSTDATAQASATTGSTYLPLSVGSRWVYAERTGAFRKRKIEVTALGPHAVRDLESGDGDLFVLREVGDQSFLGIEDNGVIGFRRDGDFWIRYSAIGEDSAGDFRLFGEEGVRVLPLDPRSGQRWEQDAHLFRVPGSRGAVRHWRGEISHLRKLRVPAGVYEDVLKVTIEYRDPVASAAGGKPEITFEDYYARDVGLIKTVTRNHAGGGWRKIVRTLTAYHRAE